MQKFFLFWSHKFGEQFFLIGKVLIFQISSLRQNLFEFVELPLSKLNIKTYFYVVVVVFLISRIFLEIFFNSFAFDLILVLLFSLFSLKPTFSIPFDYKLFSFHFLTLKFSEIFFSARKRRKKCNWVHK